MGASFKRAVVNVATDQYVAHQERLIRSLSATGFEGRVLRWTDCLPPGSPGHGEVPYAFKLFALRQAAREGCSSVLWLDAPCRALRPLDPIFSGIEREGHYLVAGPDRLGHWASDACLAAYGLTRDEALEIPLMNGAFIGLDFTKARSREWFEGLIRASRRGLFNGAYLSDHAPPPVRARKRGKPRGFVSSDPRCWGHRHDEAVGTCLAHRLYMRMGKVDARVLRLAT